MRLPRAPLRGTVTTVVGFMAVSIYLILVGRIDRSLAVREAAGNRLGGSLGVFGFTIPVPGNEWTLMPAGIRLMAHPPRAPHALHRLRINIAVEPADHPPARSLYPAPVAQ
jgi:hypothetical protein